jgi:hypothetical protein
VRAWEPDGGVARAAIVAALIILTACGGAASATPKLATAVTSGPLGDTWTWSGSVWQQLSGPGPSARFSGAMAYDSAHGSVILYGGSALLATFGDTWSFDGKSWQQLHPAHSPGKISGATMAYDEKRSQLVLWGGAVGLGENASAVKDTWTWDGQDWTLKSHVGPSARGETGMAYDPSLGMVVLFGGSQLNTIYQDEMWAWDGAAWTKLQLTPRPFPRRGPGFTSDGQGGLLMFGGATAKVDAGPGEMGVLVGDTWRFKDGAWSELNPLLSPPARADLVMAFDPKLGRPLLFGGDRCPFKGDTWTFDGSTWKEVASSGPQPRSSAMMAAGKETVLFGGVADTPCF